MVNQSNLQTHIYPPNLYFETWSSSENTADFCGIQQAEQEVHTATAATADREQCGKERVIHVTFIFEHAGVFLSRNYVVFESWVVNGQQ